MNPDNIRNIVFIWGKSFDSTLAGVNKTIDASIMNRQMTMTGYEPGRWYPQMMRGHTFVISNTWY